MRDHFRLGEGCKGDNFRMIFRHVGDLPPSVTVTSQDEEAMAGEAVARAVRAVT